MDNRYVEKKVNKKKLLFWAGVLVMTIGLFIMPIIAILIDGALSQGQMLISLNPLSNWMILFKNESVRFMFGLLMSLFIVGIGVMSLDVIMTKKIKVKGEHGTARLMEHEEFVATVTTCTKKKEPEKGGMVICNEFKKAGEVKIAGEIYDIDKPDHDETYYVDTEDKHDLNIGTTRSGKTRREVIPSIYAFSRAKESMVINDPKGELFDKTSQYLKNKGYDVVKLDFRNAKDGNRYNFLSLIYDKIEEGDLSRAEELAKDMAHSITYREKSNGDPVWQRGEKATLAALILLVAMYGKREEAHMYSVYNNLVELGETKVDPEGFEYCKLNEMISNLPPGHPVKRALGTAAVAPTSMRTSFYSSALANLEIFSDPSMAYVTAETDHCLKDIGRRPTAVFLIVPDEKETRHVMSSLYVDQMYVELVDLANEHGGRLPNRVHFVLDEFGNMPPINGFASKMTVAAGRGILFHLFIQDLGQLAEKYGKIESIIKGNCHNWIYILTTDIKTAKEISEKAGYTTIKTHSKSEGDKTTYSTNVTRRALLTPSEILRFQIGEVLLLRSREQPYIGKLMDYTYYSFAKELGKPLEMPIFKDKHVPIYIAGDEIYVTGAETFGSQKKVKENITLEKKELNEETDTSYNVTDEIEEYEEQTNDYIEETQDNNHEKEESSWKDMIV